MYQIKKTPMILLIVGLIFGTPAFSWSFCIDPNKIVEGWDFKNDLNNPEMVKRTCENACSPYKWDKDKWDKEKSEPCAWYGTTDSIKCSCM